MLTHQMKRINSPSLVVLHHEAQQIPVLWEKSGEGPTLKRTPMRYDRVLVSILKSPLHSEFDIVNILGHLLLEFVAGRRAVQWRWNHAQERRRVEEVVAGSGPRSAQDSAPDPLARRRTVRGRRCDRVLDLLDESDRK
jgi:hypothetical protein